MNFLQLQENLEMLTMDDSAEYAAGSDKNKYCINKAYEYLFDIYKISDRVNTTFRSQKVAVSFVNKVADMPVDFDTARIVSVVDFSIDSDIGDISESRYFDYQISGKIGAKKMIIQDEWSKLYVQYIVKREELVDTDDETLFPDELDSLIPEFALAWYYRMIRDMTGAADALALSQQMLNTKLAALG